MLPTQVWERLSRDPIRVVWRPGPSDAVARIGYNEAVPTPKVLRARSWQISVAATWVAAATAASSMRYQQLDEHCAAVDALLRGEIRDAPAARAVIHQLLATLKRCDALPFATEDQCMAYICWHVADRYGRT